MNVSAIVSFCMLSIAATTKVSARPVLIVNRNGEEWSKTKEHKIAVSAPRIHVPQASASVAAPIFPFPEGGYLHLFGLNSTEPLTLSEATFLEETIRDAFNKIHEENGIDLVASAVGIVNDVVVDGSGNEDEDESNLSSLRGRRKLPETDHEMCDYQYGPKKGQKIPGCVFDIEFYMDCYCHDCFDDDFQFYWNNEKPTQAPVLLDEKFATPSITPSIVPSVALSIAPTDNTGIGLEKERSPPEPDDDIADQINKKVLKRLRQSPFHRFNKLKKIRFRGGN